VKVLSSSEKERERERGRKRLWSETRQKGWAGKVSDPLGSSRKRAGTNTEV